MANDSEGTDTEVAPVAAKRASASRSKSSVVAIASSPAKKKKRNKKKKSKPGKYSVLVVEAIKTLNERNGSSLVKIYNEAKKASFFDQQNGRTYLRYSVRALVLNDTLIQVKGLGANGSFRLNKKKFEKTAPKKPAAKTTTKTTKKAPTPKRAVVAAKKPKAKVSPKKKTPAKKKPAAKPKKVAAKPKKVSAAAKSKKPAKKASKPTPTRSPRKK